MRGWSTLALVAAAIGLGAYIYFVESKRSDTEVKEKVFAVEADALEEITVTAKGDTTVLRKADGAWKMVQPVATEVDDNQVSALVNSLTSLEITRVVEPNAPDLAEFGLGTPKTDLSFKAKGGVTGRLRLGDQTPTASDIYAVKGDDKRVFLVGTFVETSLAHSAFELRDKRVLRFGFERDKADGLEITTAAGRATLARTDSTWRVTAPVAGRGDYGAIEGLLTKLTTTMMSEIAGTDVTDLKAFGLDKPAATVTVKAGSSSATLAVSAAKDGKTYARDLARTLVFVVDNTFATDLQKGVEDYRRKEVFEFRPFSANALTLVRGAQTITVQKVKGSGANAAEKWQVTVTGEGAAPARDADDAAANDLLDKLTALRAQTFATAGPAAPALKVSVTYEDTKKEEVSFGRTGEKAFAVRADEAGAMELASTALTEALAALDNLLKPPAPPTPPTPTPAPAAGGATPEKKP